MKITPVCVECIVKQSLTVAKNIGASQALEKQLFQAIEQDSHNFSFSLTPPHIAKDTYAKMALLANKEDLFKETKALCTQKALEYLPFLQEKLKASTNPLLTATKIAIAGNVIDFAAGYTFSLEDELNTIFDTNFGIDDLALLEQALKKSTKLLYIGDNAGEHVFDKLYIKTLQNLFPRLNITYLTRGCAIINDVTYEEALEIGMHEVCSVKSSGVNAPGFIYEQASKEAQKLFDKSDFIIAKGMGNFETMTEREVKPVFHLLKVKCSEVSRHLGQPVGNIICKLNLRDYNF